ncbi:ScyD/ScyE family protein [Cellulosimicrobium marinum]|uniref:ScyD/ScyE family protein n=1 Tax=Cellulosimicrobium marinum TaxID=1638992 RepID=UPI001E5598F2|nr:ScyD/ScyE family protein [Cellulosimicrobium marinum]MCB7136028.1 ScyD/ScyE family protein [Cellulosimicrobium marinum]
MRRVPTVLAAAATSLLLAATPAVAHGGGKPDPRPPAVTDLTGGLVGPLSLAAGWHGTTYVTQNFAGLLTAVDRDGEQSVLYGSANGAEVGGVSFDGLRTLTFTETESDETGITGSSVHTLRLDKKGAPSGAPRLVLDTYAYEQKHNPDGKTTYGLRDTDPACVAQVPAGGPISPLYTGIVDSHPYATASLLGTTFVADAGTNTLLSVSPFGKARTLAVLPAQPAVVTAEAAAGIGWPDCVVGETYWFEAVPTDVEVGPWGQLYVSTLPGGPEDASLGARGAVYTVDPWSGKVRKVASGFVSATGVAVSPTGTVYVAEMFGGRISQATSSGPRTVVETALPGALEWTSTGLLATTNVLPGEEGPPDGHLVRVGFPRGR